MADPEEEPTEDELVCQWRHRELRAGGFDELDALRLAGDFDVDVHQALALVADGCPPRLATKILA